MADSETARAAERASLTETLETLHTTLTDVAASRNLETAEALFSNAASSLFCQSRLLTSTPVGEYANLQQVAIQVEDALLQLQRKNLTAPHAAQVMELLESEMARLKSCGT